MASSAHALIDWPRPLLLGHRGSREQLPENSMEAIQHAAALGVHGFEIDVRLNADGSLVVFHDPTLFRLSGRRDKRPIAMLSDSALKAFDLGGGARIPLLSQVLTYCRERQLLLDVEVKHDVPSRTDLVRQVARVLADFCDGSVFVSSFDPRIVLALRKQLPRLPRALIVGKRSLQLSMDRLLPLMDAAAICIDHEQLDRARRWQRWQQVPRIFSWTVNEPERAKALLGRGVDGIITDLPSVVSRALLAQVTTSAQ